MDATTRRKWIVTTTIISVLGLALVSRIDRLSKRYLIPIGVSVRMRLYKKTIKKHAAQHDLDWRLICAVIRQESSFNPRAKSRPGAKGLMQLMPYTARELGVYAPYDPEQNIAGGVRYLRQQYDRFPNSLPEDRLQLGLASYNAGLGHVLDARAIVRYEGHDPNRWMPVRATLGKLTLEHRYLHRQVWRTGRPKHGYFPGYRQTIEYVHRVMGYYEQYQRKEQE